MLKNRPEDHSVRAIIVYPMNALINSQLEALQDFAKNWPGCPLTFRPLHRSGPRQGTRPDPHRSAAHPAHQLRDARIHADPSDGSRADSPGDSGAKIPRGRRVARLSRSAGRRCRHADAPRPPARWSRRPHLHRHVGHSRHAARIAPTAARKSRRSAVGSLASRSSRNVSSTRRCGGSPRSRCRRRAKRCERRSKRRRRRPPSTLSLTIRSRLGSKRPSALISTATASSFGASQSPSRTG